jgi:hypothetical protein
MMVQMSGSQSQRSPLARLVLFMVCLAIAGSAVAAAHYYAIDLPMQQIAPHNDLGYSPPPIPCNQCSENCNLPWTPYALCYMACMDNCVK